MYEYITWHASQFDAIIPEISFDRTCLKNKTNADPPFKQLIYFMGNSFIKGNESLLVEFCKILLSTFLFCENNSEVNLITLHFILCT